MTSQKSRRFVLPRDFQRRLFCFVPRSFRERVAAHLPGLGGPIRMLLRGAGLQRRPVPLCLSKMRPVHLLVNNKQRAMFTLRITNGLPAAHVKPIAGALAWC